LAVADKWTYGQHDWYANKTGRRETNK